MKVTEGIYPTMITPYTQTGEVDYEAVAKTVRWYWKEGCDGIFADCLSSEIFQLSKEERVRILRTVVRTNRQLSEEDPDRKPLMIVASGHVSDSFEEQVSELTAIANEGPDALVLIANRMDIENTSDDKWIEDAERLLEALPKEISLGLYECPYPYRRVLTEKMIRWCAGQRRFYFIKDICSDNELIRQRLEWCKGSNLKLFNANAPTLLQSLKDGAAGYCGIMANIHPALYKALYQMDWNSKEASDLQDFLSKSLKMKKCYPCCAKYALNCFESIPMSIESRMTDAKEFDRKALQAITKIMEESKQYPL